MHSICVCVSVCVCVCVCAHAHVRAHYFKGSLTFTGKPPVVLNLMTLTHQVGSWMAGQPHLGLFCPPKMLFFMGEWTF